MNPNQERRERIKLIVITVIIIILTIWLITYGNRFMQSYSGKPYFPKGCWETYPLNTTHSGQQIHADKNYCYTKEWIGYYGSGILGEHNQYRGIKWERTK